MAGMNINSYTKRTKMAKDQAGIAALAMSIAKARKDPLARRAEIFKKRWITFKQQVVQKYGPRARSLYFARKAGKAAPISKEIKKSKQK
jgi:hypothetical protein